MNDLCGHPHTTLLKDGYPADDASNAVMQAALVANCMPPPTPGVLEKGAPGAINPTTGRPLAGPDDLLTVAGGAFVQKTVAYLDLAGATPVYLVASDSAQSWQYWSRALGGRIVAEMPYAAFSPTHDIILIELVRDTATRTLRLDRLRTGSREHRGCGPVHRQRDAPEPISLRQELVRVRMDGARPGRHLLAEGLGPIESYQSGLAAGGRASQRG